MANWGIFNAESLELTTMFESPYVARKRYVINRLAVLITVLHFIFFIVCLSFEIYENAILHFIGLIGGIYTNYISINGQFNLTRNWAMVFFIAHLIVFYIVVENVLHAILWLIPLSMIPVLLIDSRKIAYAFLTTAALMAIYFSTTSKDFFFSGDQALAGTIIYYINTAGSLISVMIVGMILNDTRNWFEKKVSEKYENIYDKNQRIHDSLLYAKRVQNAILPPEKLLKNNLDDHFIINKPKDIVSGDFYWFEQKDDWVFFAIADGTDNGVPGAMVSILAHTALTRCIDEYGLTDPKAILEKMDRLLEETVRFSDINLKDMLGLGVCAYQVSTGWLKFSGARNSLYIISRDTDVGNKVNGGLPELRIFRLEGDRKYLGVGEGKNVFTTHRIRIHKGDTLYMLTDGYVNESAKKSIGAGKREQLLQQLLQIKELEFAEQKNVLESVISQSSNRSTQKDDITLMALRF